MEYTLALIIVVWHGHPFGFGQEMQEIYVSCTYIGTYLGRYLGTIQILAGIGRMACPEDCNQ